MTAAAKVSKATVFGIAGFAAFAAILIVFVLLATYKLTSRADPFDAESVALGARVYSHHCATCHGVDLRGQADWQAARPDGSYPAPPQDETGHTWEHSDLQNFQFIKFGYQKSIPDGIKVTMPRFRDVLAADEIWAVLAFIKSKWPEEIRRKQAIAAFSAGAHAH